MSDLEKKLEIFIYTQKFYAGCEISANYPLFSKSNSIEIKQYQFFYLTVELAKLSMSNYNLWLTFAKLKLK